MRSEGPLLAQQAAVVADAAARLTASVDGSGLLLNLIRERETSTISELSTAMGLARSTVIQRMDHLMERGLIVNEPGSSPTRGRPAVVSRFNHEAAVVLAAQIGITGSRLAVTDLSGQILFERFITVDVPAGPDQMLSDLESAFDELLATAERDRVEVAGVGVGIPSALELGTYVRSLGLPGAVWDRGYFQHSLRNRYGSPVFLDLDVNMLALAERRMGWPDVEVFVCVKLGTLINAAIVVNGRAILGFGNLAGELGHLKVSGSTVPCSCGSTGCLDAVASGNALVKQLSAAGFDVAHVADVVALANQGQPEAVLAIREAGRHVGAVLGSVSNLLNPGVIVTWGYLTGAEAPLFAGIREGLYQTALPDSSAHLELRITALGDLAGVHGAALMVIDEVLAPGAVDRLITAKSWQGAWPAGSDDS